MATQRKSSKRRSSEYEHISTRNVDNFRVELTKLQKPVENFLRENEISVLHGMAGTGKDFIQLHRAIKGLLDREFEQVIFMRTAVEVGESIGFLPGEEKDKLAPYEKLFYENLSKMLEKSVFERVKGKIKFEHIGFVRGRSFDHACIILSEAQNCSLHEIMTVCTRLSSSSKLLINGDKFQIDVRNSGFSDFLKIADNVRGIGVLELGDEFQMRNPLIVRLDKEYRRFVMNKTKYNEQRN